MGFCQNVQSSLVSELSIEMCRYLWTLLELVQPSSSLLVQHRQPPQIHHSFAPLSSELWYQEKFLSQVLSHLQRPPQESKTSQIAAARSADHWVLLPLKTPCPFLPASTSHRQLVPMFQRETLNSDGKRQAPWPSCLHPTLRALGHTGQERRTIRVSLAKKEVITLAAASGPWYWRQWCSRDAGWPQL